MLLDWSVVLPWPWDDTVAEAKRKLDKKKEKRNQQMSQSVLSRWVWHTYSTDDVCVPFVFTCHLAGPTLIDTG